MHCSVAYRAFRRYIVRQLRNRLPRKPPRRLPIAVPANSTVTPRGCIVRHTSSARTAAARLVAHETRKSDGAPDGVYPAAHALQRAALELSRWVGADGCHALVKRAVSRAAQAHPILHDVQIDTNSAPIVIAVEDVVGAHNAAAVAAALNATLVEFFELLVRVVGEDLTMKLAEQVTAHATAVVPEGGEEPV